MHQFVDQELPASLCDGVPVLASNSRSDASILATWDTGLYLLEKYYQAKIDARVRSTSLAIHFATRQEPPVNPYNSDFPESEETHFPSEDRLPRHEPSPHEISAALSDDAHAGDLLARLAHLHPEEPYISTIRDPHSPAWHKPSH